MTVLKVLCVTSCIGGLVPVVASSDSLKSAEQSFTDFLKVDEMTVDEMTQATLSTLPPTAYRSSNARQVLAKGSFILNAGHSVLERFESMVDSASSVSILPHVSFNSSLNPQSLSQLASGDIKADVQNLSLVPGDRQHDGLDSSRFNTSSPSDAPLSTEPQQTHDHHTNDAVILLERQTMASIAHVKPSMVTVPTVDVVSVSSEHRGQSVVDAPFKLNDSAQSSVQIPNIEQCALTPSFASANNLPTSTSEVKVTHSHPETISTVRIDQHMVAEFATEEEATVFAESVKSFIQSDYFLPHELEVRPTGDAYLIATEDVVITEVMADVSLKEYNSALVAIAWTNNLRVALGAEPLAMGEAQAQIQALESNGRRIDGIASWYGPYFHGRLTASGEYFDQNELTAAHPSLPFDTYLNVTNLKNGRSVVVRINDRGPYIGRRSLDLSRRAAQCLGSEEVGVVPYTATFLDIQELPTLEGPQDSDVAALSSGLN
jgi:rare lipoprotein A (peptidoglycan hydrolase)